MLAIETDDLKKHYLIYKSFFNRFRKKAIKIEALKGISLSVKEKEIFGLLGPNGAGKTTFMNILSTILLPDSGTAKVFGFDVVKDEGDVKKMISLSSAYSGFYYGLTARENLKFFGMVYDSVVDIDKIVEMVGLERYVDTVYDELSSGNKQKLTIAKSFMSKPKLMLLDELTVALDPKIASDIRRLIENQRRKNKTTIFMTTHNMQEAEELCDRIAIIHKGEIVACDTASKLKKLVREEESIEIFIAENKNPYFLTRIKGVKNLVFNNYRVVVHADDADKRIESIVKSLLSNHYHIKTIRIREPTLEDAFIKLTGVELE